MEEETISGGCPHPACVWAGHPEGPFQDSEVGPLAGRKPRCFNHFLQNKVCEEVGWAPRLAGRRPPDPGKAGRKGIEQPFSQEKRG